MIDIDTKKVLTRKEKEEVVLDLTSTRTRLFVK